MKVSVWSSKSGNLAASGGEGRQGPGAAPVPASLAALLFGADSLWVVDSAGDGHVSTAGREGSEEEAEVVRWLRQAKDTQAQEPHVLLTHLISLTSQLSGLLM